MRAFHLMLLSAALLCGSDAGLAAIVQQDLNIEYSGGTPPAGNPPWLRATFNDFGGSGSVEMTLTALNLTGSEFVNDWLFNLDPVLDPSALSFGVQSATSNFALPSVLTGSNAFKAAGNTSFDIKVDFAVATPPNRFDAGDSITFLVTGIPSLNANSFNFLSEPGGQGPFFSAAHVQGIGPTGDESGWVAHVPEPGTLWGLTLAGFVLRRRR